MPESDLKNWQAMIGTSGRSCIMVERGAEQFHIWLAASDGLPTLRSVERTAGRMCPERALYANPLTGENRKSRVLDAEAKKNKPLVDAMLARAPALIAEARQRESDEGRKAAREAVIAAAAARLRDHAPALLLALEPLHKAAREQAKLDRHTAAQYGPTTGNAQAYRDAAKHWDKLADVAAFAIKRAKGDEPSRIAEIVDEQIPVGARARLPGGTLKRVDLVRGEETGEVRAQWYSDQQDGIRVGAFLPGRDVFNPGDTPKVEPEVSTWVGAEQVEQTVERFVQSAVVDGWRLA